MTKKVLVVDDAQFMRMMIKDVISSMSLDVIDEGKNGLEAIEKYQQHKPDLVTLDLVMPEVSGLEALKKIREIDPDASVIVISAIDQRESLMEAIRLGAKDFIVKPFEESRIESAVKKVLGL